VWRDAGLEGRSSHAESLTSRERTPERWMDRLADQGPSRFSPSTSTRAAWESYTIALMKKKKEEEVGPFSARAHIRALVNYVREIRASALTAGLEGFEEGKRHQADAWESAVDFASAPFILQAH
jgi:hypothetical protein